MIGLGFNINQSSDLGLIKVKDQTCVLNIPVPALVHSKDKKSLFKSDLGPRFFSLLYKNEYQLSPLS